MDDAVYFSVPTMVTFGKIFVYIWANES